MRRLAADGADVRVAVRHVPPANSKSPSASNIQYVKCNVLDKEGLARTFEGADGVFHLAGVVDHSKRNEAAMREINVQGTLNSIAAAKAAGVPRVVGHETLWRGL